MKRVLAAGIVLAALTLSGCGSSNVAVTPGDTSTPTVTADPTPTSSPTPETLYLSPDGFGPLQLGMTKQEALGTGLVDVDVFHPADVCDSYTADMEFKPEWKDALDIYFDPTKNAVVDIGSRDESVTTPEGIGVGSTYADVQAAYGDSLVGPEKTGYDQWGVFVRSGDNWLGFLLGEALARKPKPGDKVTMMEILLGKKPGLMRDGC